MCPKFDAQLHVSEMILSTYIKISELTVEVQKKRIKKMHLHVQPTGRVLVTAPLEMPDESVELFVHQNLAWIRQSLQELTTPKESRLEVCGVSVEVQLKRIKNMHLHVRQSGQVLVTAPLSMSQDAIKLFVLNNLDWIRKQQAKFAARPAETLNEFVSGETIMIWGQPYTISLRPDPQYSLELLGNRALFCAPAQSTPALRKAFIVEWLRAELKKKVLEFLPKWEARTGLYSSAWQTKLMKTRWGTCNTRTRHIWLNVQLAHHSPICLEYVILHELAHLHERTHGPRFVAVLDAHMPNWREIRKLLNGKIQALDEGEE